MITTMLASLSQVSDRTVLTEVKRLAAREREATVALIAHLAELDTRRLYLAEGCASLFTYATQVLHLSEHAAYGRIEAARAARRCPLLLERLAEGSVTLTTVTLLAPHLTPANHQELLDQARHKPKREVEELVARLRQEPPVPSAVRKLPPSRQATAPSASAAPAEAAASARPAGDSPGTPAAPPPARPLTTPPRPPVVAPLAPDRYRVQFTASADTYAKLRLAQDLLRHQIPDGDVAAVLDRALTALVDKLTKQKLAATARPRGGRNGSETGADRLGSVVGRRSPDGCAAGGSPWAALTGQAPTRVTGRRNARQGSRHVPAAVRRAVWKRDGGRCAFVSEAGRRCSERGFLEFHHVRPYAAGGPATVENIELRCRAHNAYQAERDFGSHSPWLVRERAGAYRRLAPRRTRSGPRCAHDQPRATPSRHGRPGGPAVAAWPPDVALDSR